MVKCLAWTFFSVSFQMLLSVAWFVWKVLTSPSITSFNAYSRQYLGLFSLCMFIKINLCNAVLEFIVIINSLIFQSHSLIMRDAKLKVIRKFFLTHNKSVRWYLGDYEKHNFFPFEGLWEEKLWFLCVLTDV